MTRFARPTDAQEHAFLRSILYASVFDYPLTEQQLHESLIGVRAEATDLAAWYANSELLQQAIEHRDGYYFPRGRRDMVDVRRAREESSRHVLRELQRPLALVVRLPFVRMVALSGSLAHLNAEGDADLDLFVITARGHVWSVTTTAILIARLFGWRKRLCLNYVVGEDAMSVSPRDLFAANQIIHLRPVTGSEMYQRFIVANPFAAHYYPNFQPRPVQHPQRPPAAAVETLLEWTVAPLFERVCRRAYGWYLRRRSSSWQSSDQVRLDPDCLKLHTSSHRRRVIHRFETAVAEAERSKRVAAIHAHAVP